MLLSGKLHTAQDHGDHFGSNLPHFERRARACYSLASILSTMLHSTTAMGRYVAHT